MPQAVLSVSDKTGIADLARELSARGWTLLSTGGTAQAIREAEVPVTGISEHTGFPEILGGRVKTLHPAVHGGLLARLSVETDVRDLERHGIEPIALVVVNLYPFQDTVSRPETTLAAALQRRRTTPSCGRYVIRRTTDDSSRQSTQVEIRPSCDASWRPRYSDTPLRTTPWSPGISAGYERRDSPRRRCRTTSCCP
jgi:hypothetical protein